MEFKKTHPFYLSTAWRKCRAAVLARDNYLCQRCLTKNRLTSAEMVHHIMPLEEYPERALEMDNLVSLCNICHSKVHMAAPEQEQERDRRARIIIG